MAGAVEHERCAGDTVAAAEEAFDGSIETVTAGVRNRALIEVVVTEKALANLSGRWRPVRWHGIVNCADGWCLGEAGTW